MALAKAAQTTECLRAVLSPNAQGEAPPQGPSGSRRPDARAGRSVSVVSTGQTRAQPRRHRDRRGGSPTTYFFTSSARRGSSSRYSRSSGRVDRDSICACQVKSASAQAVGRVRSADADEAFLLCHEHRHLVDVFVRPRQQLRELVVVAPFRCFGWAWRQCSGCLDLPSSRRVRLRRGPCALRRESDGRKHAAMIATCPTPLHTRDFSADPASIGTHGPPWLRDVDTRANGRNRMK
jgi:hypothetical protein